MSHFIYEHVPGIGLGNRRPKVTGSVGALIPTGYRIYKDSVDLLFVADTHGDLTRVVTGLPAAVLASMENPTSARSSRRSMRVGSKRSGTGVSSKKAPSTYTSREGSNQVESRRPAGDVDSAENPETGVTYDPAELREDDE